MESDLGLTATEAYHLPPEILDLIIASISDSDTTVALPAYHIDTKTLLSCLFVCKATYASSLKQLHQRCLHIDSARKLRALLRSYDSDAPLYGRAIAANEFKRSNSSSMFLAPFPADTIDEAPIVDGLLRLSNILSPHLKRLLIDMPLRSYYPDEPGSPNLRAVLRKAFLSLTALEEFVSVRDELYLSTRTPSDYSAEPPVWSTWKNLQRLALYNLDTNTGDDDYHVADNWFMPAIVSSMPNLQVLVMTRPDMEAQSLLWQLWHQAWSHSLRLAIVNTWRDHPLILRPQTGLVSLRSLGYTATIHRFNPDMTRGKVPAVDVVCVDGRDPVTDPRERHNQNVGDFTGNNWAAYDLRHTYNDIRVCQQWVKVHALSGEIWPS